MNLNRQITLSLYISHRISSTYGPQFMLTIKKTGHFNKGLNSLNNNCNLDQSF
jgi:hypothetical protein